MSSDLWGAFASGAKDLSDNPWAQPRSDTPARYSPPIAPQLNENRIQKKPVDHKLSTTVEKQTESQNESLWEAPVIASREQYAGVIVDSWPNFDDEPQNVWGPPESVKPITSRWLDHAASASAVGDFDKLIGSAPGSPQEEDFGDFEDPNSLPRGEPKFAPLLMTNREILHTLPSSADIWQNLQSSPHASHKKPHSTDEADPYADLELMTKPEQSTEKVTKTIPPVRPAAYSTREKPRPRDLSSDVPYTAEEWNEFSPGLRSSPGSDLKPISSTQFQKGGQSRTKTVKTQSHAKTPTLERLEKKNTEPAKTHPPPQTTSASPTNIPPPSILLSFTADLIGKLPSEITSMIQDPSIAQGSQKTLEKAVTRWLSHLRVAARIFAGRKYRWKRDTLLSQNMSIGPAQGRSGGMKLVGVDKVEIRREDREAAELLRIWKLELGGLRAALAPVSSLTNAKPLLLPEMSEHMVIRALRSSEGGITGSKCCFLCGLKRDERIIKTDMDVDDTFGEWWTDHWGHTDCKDFWEHYEDGLRKR